MSLSSLPNPTHPNQPMLGSPQEQVCHYLSYQAPNTQTSQWWDLSKNRYVTIYPTKPHTPKPANGGISPRTGMSLSLLPNPKHTNQPMVGSIQEQVCHYLSYQAPHTQTSQWWDLPKNRYVTISPTKPQTHKPANGGISPRTGMSLSLLPNPTHPNQPMVGSPQEQVCHYLSYQTSNTQTSQWWDLPKNRYITIDPTKPHTSKPANGGISPRTAMSLFLLPSPTHPNQPMVGSPQEQVYHYLSYQAPHTQTSQWWFLPKNRYGTISPTKPHTPKPANGGFSPRTGMSLSPLPSPKHTNQPMVGSPQAQVYNYLSYQAPHTQTNQW